METTNDSPKTTCDGLGLKRLAAAGLAWLERHAPSVDALNVFPVPDGDTGKNMMLTMRKAYEEVSSVSDSGAGMIARKLAQGALMGARGNSGVILSQLWRGLARVFDGHETFDAELLARGLREATETAYRGVSQPVEGTLLTVSREIADEAERAVAEGVRDLITMLERIVGRCREAVARTPEQLPILKRAGVVDAGGQGLAVILEGMLNQLRGIELIPEIEARAGAVAAVEPHPELEPGEEGYGYDVQFILIGQDMDVDEVRRNIEAMGVSTVVVGDERTIKVHVHVNDPGQPLSYGASLGQLMDVVVENLQMQYQEFVGKGSPAEVPLVAGEEQATISVVAVASGDGLAEIFKSLKVAKIVSGGQTMNPSTEDILAAINELVTPGVIVLPNNKNIIMAAEQAAQMADRSRVVVVPTRTIPQGFSAMLAFDPEGDLDEVAEQMAEASMDVETGEVTFATRSVELNGVNVEAGQVIGLHNGELKVAGDDLADVVEKLLGEMGAEECEIITLYYGEGVTRSEAEALKARLEQRYPDQEIEVHAGGQPHYPYLLGVE